MYATQNRREFKFVLSPGHGTALRSCIGQHLTPDKKNPDGYWVSSEYQDTPRFHHYWEKLLDVPSRRHLRLRCYESTGPCHTTASFIEIKHKSDGVAVKRRIPAAPQDLIAFAQKRLPASESPQVELVKREIEIMWAGSAYEPIIQLHYWRHAYDDGEHGRLRITFDTQITCRSPIVPLLEKDPPFNMPLADKGIEIMEVKTIGPVPFWMRRLIGEQRLLPRGYSKYVTAVSKYRMGGSPPHNSPAGTAPPASMRI